jgi:molybdate transport system substrate-binding protein
LALLTCAAVDAATITGTNAMICRACNLFAIILAASMMLPAAAKCETVKVLTAGAFKLVLLAVLPAFQAYGHEVQFEADTVGGLVKRIEAGETFDVVFASPAALATIRKAGKIGGGVDLARVGVGVAIKEGAKMPDLGSVESFKRLLLRARSVAYVDPASGGTSGIYVAHLIDRLGIGDELRAKSILVQGGYSAERVASGEADIAIQQISEILPVKGVVLAGPLPLQIQNYTIYSAAIGAGSSKASTAQILIDLLQSPEGSAAIRTKGMEPLRPTQTK